MTTPAPEHSTADPAQNTREPRMVIAKSVCHHCGRSVVERPSIGLFDPIGAANSRKLAEHRCQPEDLIAFEQDLHHLAGTLSNHQVLIRQIQQATAVDLHTEPAQLNKLAAQHCLHLACPRCEAGIGQMCQNLTERRRGKSVATSKPHDQRLPSRNVIAQD